VQGDRLDNLAARYLGDPEQFWKICDANNVLRPDELTEEIGRVVRIALPYP
jgi:nucleoid-associated protein YgaU